MIALAAGGSLACAPARVRSPAASDVAARELTPPREALGPSELATAAAWIYRVPTACPDEARFLDELARRLPPLSAQDVAAAVGPRVEVDVHGSEHAWSGRVVFRAAEGRISREVSGADCDEVIVALALITSLWVRPDDARSESNVPPSPARTVGRAPDANAMAAAGDVPTAGSETDAANPSPLAPPAAARGSALAESQAASDTGSASAAADAGGDARPARFLVAGLLAYSSEPSGAFGARVQVERWGSASVSSWSTSLGLSYAAGQHENDRLGPAALRLLHAQLELCPPGVDLEQTAWLRACAQGRAGVLHFSAETERVPDASPHWRPWATLGVGVHAGVPVASSLSLRLLAAVSLTVVRDEFATERPPLSGSRSAADVFTFYEISPVAFDLGIGAAHVFP